LVNSARISALQLGNGFTWTNTRAEILRSLTDVTLSARFLALAKLKRKSGAPAKLWVSQVLTRKALLEDPRLPTPITLPESLYLELAVGQMSPAETTVFDIPSIGDDLNAMDNRGTRLFTLQKLKTAVDACSNPPAFRGVKTPITELIDGEKDTNPAQSKNRNDKDKRERRPGLQARQNTKDDCPAHEQPSALPSGLKRPDLNATVGGRKISSEAQRQLFDDVKAVRCVRCHKPGHARAKCRSEPLRFEEKFD
jgi:hypothetical protein